MNIFVAIERIDDLCGEKVSFYSVRLGGKIDNEFFDFLNRMEVVVEIEDDLNNLILWLDKIAIVKQINKMFQERIIEWNEDFTDIIL